MEKNGRMEFKFVKLILHNRYLNALEGDTIILNMNYVYQILPDENGGGSRIFISMEELPIYVKESYHEILKKLEESIKM